MEWLNCYDAKETETIHIKSPAKQPSDENGCAQRVEDKFTVGAKRPAMALANITNTLNVDSTESGKRRAIEPPGVMSKLITNVELGGDKVQASLELVEGVVKGSVTFTRAGEEPVQLTGDVLQPLSPLFKEDSAIQEQLLLATVAELVPPGAAQAAEATAAPSPNKEGTKSPAKEAAAGEERPAAGQIEGKAEEEEKVQEKDQEGEGKAEQTEAAAPPSPYTPHKGPSSPQPFTAASRALSPPTPFTPDTPAVPATPHTAAGAEGTEGKATPLSTQRPQRLDYRDFDGGNSSTPRSQALPPSPLDKPSGDDGEDEDDVDMESAEAEAEVKGAGKDAEATPQKPIDATAPGSGGGKSATSSPDVASMYLRDNALKYTEEDFNVRLEEMKAQLQREKEQEVAGIKETATLETSKVEEAWTQEYMRVCEQLENVLKEKEGGTTKFTQLETELLNTKNLLELKSQEVERLVRTTEDQKAANVDLVQRLHQLTKQAADMAVMKTRAETAEGRVKEVEASLASQADTLAAMSSRVEELEKSEAEAKEAGTRSAQKVEKLTAAVKRIQDEANSMLAERRQEYLAVVNKVTELEEANKELQGEVAAVKQGKEAAVKATEEAQQSLKDTKTKLKMRDTYCEELEKDVKRLKEDLALERTKVSQYEEDLSAAHKEIEHFKSSAASNDELEESKKLAATLQSKVEEYEKAMDALKSERDSLEADRKELSSYVTMLLEEAQKKG